MFTFSPVNLPVVTLFRRLSYQTCESRRKVFPSLQYELIWVLIGIELCLLQIHMLKFSLQCDNISRWGLSEVLRVRWGHEHRGPYGEIRDFIRIRQHKITLYHMRTQWEDEPLQARKTALTRNQIGLHLDLGLFSIQNHEKLMSLFKPLNLWYFSIAAQAD